MRFILVLCALAGATCVALVIVQPGRAPGSAQAAQPAPRTQAPPAPEAGSPAEVDTAHAAAPVSMAVAPAPSPQPAPAAPVARPVAAAPAVPHPAITIQPPRGLEGYPSAPRPPR